MDNPTLIYKKIRKKIELDLNSLPLKERVSFLVDNYRRCVMIAKKHGAKTVALENEEKSNESKR